MAGTSGTVMGELDKLIWRELEEDRLECYKNISELLTESTLDGLQAKELKKKIDEILKVLLQDIASERADVAQPSLQILGYILLLAASAENESLLSAVSQSDILDKLLSVIMKTGDKQICTRSLWCLSKQNFIKTILVDKIDKALEVLVHAQCSKKFQSMTVEHESINLLIRFLEQIPDELKARADKWGKLLYPHLVHGAPKVRERAFLAMEMALPMLLPHRDVLAKQLAADLKTLLLSDLKKLMTGGQEMYALDVWMVYVQLLGKILHHGSLINSMLPITEQGFKNTKPAVKCASYKAWKVLIDNFALTHDIVSDQKRVKLIMQVFKINNTKTEGIAMEKLAVWWHFVVQLAGKASFYFEQVIVPLLQYIVGGGYLQVTVQKPGTPLAITPVQRKGQPSPATPNINVKAGTPGATLGGFDSVIEKGFEVLARLVGCSAEDVEGFKFSYAELKPDVITGITFFQKNASVFISTFKLLVESGVQVHEGLLFQTWCSLVAHTKNSLEVGSKKDSLEVFTSLVTCYQEIVSSQRLPSGLLLKMMDALLCLPSKILGSAAYSISGSRDQMMQGCPALVLVEMLFHDRILETQAASGNEKFFVLLEKLVQKILSTPSNALQSCDNMLQLVEKATLAVDNKESLWRMWSAIVNPLHIQIGQTNEVNQGDALEYNFNCLTRALSLPIVRILAADLPQGTLKAMLKTWVEIYTSFSRLASMVSNAEANIACEVVCNKINFAKINIKNSPIHVEALAMIVLNMTEKVDFSSLSNNFGFLGVLSHSPGQFGKKKHCKSLGNISGLVHLHGQVIEGLHTTGKMDPQELKKLTTMTSLQTAALNLIHVTSVLFNQLPTSQMVSSATLQLVDPLSHMFGDSAITTNKVYSSQVLHKLDKMWMDIVTSLQSRFNGPYDNDFLNEISPILQTTFTHPRRAIKNQTLILWNATFAKASNLDYTDDLKAVLKEVRQKNPTIILPGWQTTEMIDETPVSQMTQSDSQQVHVPPNIIGFQSPVKNVGSFLNKSVSPNVKNSPLRKSPAAKKAVRSLNDMKDDDFVVINNLPKKKRVLTSHQKEIMKERTTLPVMYNNLDISQDQSLMSQFLSTDSQSQMSQMSTPTPTSDMAIAPFPFILPDKPVEKKTAKEANQQTALNEAAEKERSDANEKSTDKKGPKTRRRSIRFKDDKNSEEESLSQDQSFEEKEPEKKENESKETSKESEESTSKEVSDSEVVVIGSETQDFSNAAIVIESQTQDFSKQNEKMEVDVMEGSETQSTDCSQTDDSVKVTKEQTKEEIGASETLKKVPSLNPDGEGTPRRSRRQAVVTDSENTAKKNLSKETKDKNSQDKNSQDKNSQEKKNLSKETKDENSQNKNSQSSKGNSGNSQSSDWSQNSEEKPSIKAESPVKPKKRGRPKKIASPKKMLSPERTNSITKYLSKSPLKPEPVTLVEDTQFMVDELPVKAETTADISVVETPTKDDIEISKGDIDEASRTLAGKLASSKSLSDSFTSSLEEVASVAVAENQEIQVPLKPLVQLERMSPSDIEKHKKILRNRSGSDSDSSANEKTGKENKARSSQLKRRNSLLKFSRAAKANQDSPDSRDGSTSSIPPVNMDDIVPCSQDPFEFQKKLQASDDEKLPKSERKVKFEDVNEDDKEVERTDEKEEEEMEVEQEVAAVPETEMGAETQNETSSQQSESENAKSNPDILPLNSSEIEESDNSQQTIVGLKERPFKSDSADETESSQNISQGSQSRPKRIRTPKKNFWDRQDDPDSHRKSLTKSESETDSSQKVKKKRGRPKKLQNSLEASVTSEQRLFQPTINDEKLSSSEEMVKEDPKDDSKSEDVEKLAEELDGEKTEESEKQLDDIVNKKCNLDTESDEEANSDVPLSVVKNNLDVSADDIPLSELVPDPKVESKLDTDQESKESAGESTNEGSLVRRRSLSRMRKRGTKRRRSNEKSPKNSPKAQNSEAAVTVKDFLAESEDDIKEPPKSEGTDSVETPQTTESSAESTKVSSSSDANDKEKQTTETQSKPSPRISAQVGKGPSPPKKGKPFDIPETPTSTNKKFVSRASYILEQARKISISKAFPSPSVHNRKKFTGIKSSPRLTRPFPGGILKARVSVDNTSSPPPNRMPSSPSFRPVNLPRVYSPSASPSAGILKRRRITEDVAVDSPSPPCKQRRVCFNDDLDVLVTSPNNASPSKPVNRCLELAKGQQSHSSSKTKLTKRTDSKNDNFAVPKNITRPKDSQQMSMSQASVSCTQESQLNGTDPICPHLVECDVPVEQVLPQLTSSTWVRGLSKFVRSKNIKTVGDLSSLTECEIHLLPLRSPRVQTVRQVLGAFTSKGKKKESSAPEVTEQSSPSKLPNVDDELEGMSPIKGDMDTSIDSDDGQHLQLDATNSEETMNNQEAVVNDEVSAVATKSDVADAKKTTASTPKVTTSALQLVNDFTNSMNEDLLSVTSKDDMLEIYNKLNKTLSSVVTAMMSKTTTTPVNSLEADKS